MQAAPVFAPGPFERSGALHENSRAVADAVTDLQGDVAVLEGTNVPVAGNYALQGFRTGGPPLGQVGTTEGIAYAGSVALHAGGGLSGAVRQGRNEPNVTGRGPARALDGVAEEISGTWSFEPDAGLALHLPGHAAPLRFARGGPRLFVGNQNAADGSSVLLFLVRTGA